LPTSAQNTEEVALIKKGRQAARERAEGKDTTKTRQKRKKRLGIRNPVKEMRGGGTLLSAFNLNAYTEAKNKEKQEGKR